MSVTVLEPWARDASPFERMMKLAGTGPQASVCAAGRGGVELMIELCRRGFARVECLRQATCACADGAADMLAIPGGTATESLVAVLSRTARVLRDGGVVVLKLDEIDDDRAVEAALTRLGFAMESTVFDLAGSALVAHRVRRVERARVSAVADAQSRVAA